MPNYELLEAINLIKANNKKEAFSKLSTLVRIEPKNETAWLWLSVCIDDFEKKKYCLQKVLDINPSNEHAKKALEQLNYPQPPTTDEIIKPPKINVIEPPKKRNKLLSCLVIGSALLLLSIITGIIIFYNWFTKTSTSIVDVYMQIQSDAVCQNYNADFATETVIELGNNEYQAEGNGYKCVYKLHPEIITAEDESNSDYSIFYLMGRYGDKYGEILSFEDIK